MLDRKKKEEFIAKLLEENKTYKVISKEAHASFSDISKVNKKINGDDSVPSIQNNNNIRATALLTSFCS